VSGGKLPTDLPLVSAGADVAPNGASKLKNELKRRERQLGAIIANLPGAVYRCSVESPWVMSYVSDGVERLTGYSAQEFLSGQRAWAYIVHPDDLPDLVETVRRGVKDSGYFAADYRILTRLSEVRWIQERGMTVRDGNGVPLYLEGFLLDITQQKEAERRLRESQRELAELADAMPALIAFVDSDERYRFANRTYLDWSGLEPDEMLGRTVREVVGERIYEEIQPHVLAALTGEKVQYEGFSPTRPSGEPDQDGAGRYYDVSFIPRASTDGMVDGFYSLAADITRRKKAEDAQKLLVAELQHRTRNLLAVVQSISSKTMQNSASLDQFAREFNDRLKVLGRVQSLLSQGVERVSLSDIVSAELAAHGVTGSDRVQAAGPVVHLPSEAVQVLSLALHELATNAMKHGALSQDEAALSVSWDMTQANGRRWLVVRWREEGVVLPPRPEPAKRGFGRYLIEQALPYDLGAATDFGFAADGLHCEIRLPLASA
jgi:PAS domain S-box-containing protein